MRRSMLHFRLPLRYCPQHAPIQYSVHYYLHAQKDECPPMPVRCYGSTEFEARPRSPARSTLNRYKHRSDGIFTSRQPIAQENLRMLRSSKTLTWLSRLHCLFATSLEGLGLTTPSLVRPLRSHHDHLGIPPSIRGGLISIIHVAIKELQCLC